MNDTSPQSTEHIRYRSISMITHAVFSILFFGIGLYLLLSKNLRFTESEICGSLFTILWITLVGFSVFNIITRVEAGSDELVICFLLQKSRHIPWQDIHEVRLERRRRGLYCTIEYGRNSNQEVRFIVSYMSLYSRNKCDSLLAVIANRAELQQVGKNHWGSYVDEIG